MVGNKRTTIGMVINGGVNMRKIECEILAPVGRLCDLEQIIEAGADAVYFGLKGYSARPQEADLDINELSEARKITQEKNIKMYVIINATIIDSSLEELFCKIKQLDEIKIDALILSDLGIIDYVSKMNLKTAIHISTLTGVYNSDAIDLLMSLGAERIILSSDLFIDEIADLIERCPEVDYEIVADGGVCFNSNRQCLLPHVSTMEDYSVYCQKDYNITKEDELIGPAKRIGNCPAAIHKTLGIYIGIGIKSFKIEGRTNPLWYILKRVREMKESKDYYLSHLEEIPGCMHYIYRNADWR